MSKKFVILTTHHCHKPSEFTYETDTTSCYSVMNKLPVIDPNGS
jgi:hypothetical protein